MATVTWVFRLITLAIIGYLIFRYLPGTLQAGRDWWASVQGSPTTSAPPTPRPIAPPAPTPALSTPALPSADAIRATGYDAELTALKAQRTAELCRIQARHLTEASVEADAFDRSERQVNDVITVVVCDPTSATSTNVNLYLWVKGQSSGTPQVVATGTVSPPYPVTPGVKYVVVAQKADGTFSNQVEYRYDRRDLPKQIEVTF